MPWEQLKKGARWASALQHKQVWSPPDSGRAPWQQELNELTQLIVVVVVAATAAAEA